MTSLIPDIQSRELFSLLEIGAKISAENINIGNVTIGSDKCIVAREAIQDTVQFVIVDAANPENKTTQSISADSALMDPNSKMLLLTMASRTLQIFDLDKKAIIKLHVVNEDVVFCKWIAADTIGIVTKESVYHWSSSDESAPVKMFGRHPLLKRKITNYEFDAQGKWFLLVGHDKKKSQIVGNMQLVKGTVVQLFDYHAACFMQLKLEGNPHSTNLCCCSLRDQNSAKLDIFELSLTPGNQPYQKKSINIVYPTEAANDFPLFMQTSLKYGMLYMISNDGYVHVFDVEAGFAIYTARISSEPIFVTTLQHSPSNGVLAINNSGHVFSVGIAETIHQQIESPELPINLVSKGNLPAVDKNPSATASTALTTPLGNHSSEAETSTTSTITAIQYVLNNLVSSINSNNSGEEIVPPEIEVTLTPLRNLSAAETSTPTSFYQMAIGHDSQQFDFLKEQLEQQKAKNEKLCTENELLKNYNRKLHQRLANKLFEFQQMAFEYAEKIKASCDVDHTAAAEDEE